MPAQATSMNTTGPMPKPAPSVGASHDGVLTLSVAASTTACSSCGMVMPGGLVVEWTYCSTEPLTCPLLTRSGGTRDGAHGPASREEWRPVVRFEDRYEVSDLGRVRPVGPPLGRVPLGDVTATQMDRKGYVYVHLWRHGKRSRRPVHQLVAEAYIGPCPEGYVVDHLDSMHANNVPSNLEWVTRTQNAERAWERGEISHVADCRCVVCRRTRDKRSPEESRAHWAAQARAKAQSQMPASAPARCACGASFMTAKALAIHTTRMHAEARN